MTEKVKLIKIFNAASSTTNYEKQKYYQNKLKFNSFYPRNELPKIKDDAYIINLHENICRILECHYNST